MCIRYISLAVWITEDTAAWFLPGNSAALSCNLPHPQSWLQVKLPQSEEQRTPVGDNKGVTHLHSCGKVSALRYTVVQENVTPYTWLWHWRRALSLCQWNGSSLEVLTTFRIFWWNRSPQFFLSTAGMHWLLKHSLVCLICAFVLAMLSCVACILNCGWPWVSQRMNAIYFKWRLCSK